MPVSFRALTSVRADTGSTPLPRAFRAGRVFVHRIKSTGGGDMEWPCVLEGTAAHPVGRPILPADRPPGMPMPDPASFPLDPSASVRFATVVGIPAEGGNQPPPEFTT